MEPIPSGFVSVQAAIQIGNGQADVIGVVADLMPPKQTAGSDVSMTFNIVDPTVFDPRGLRVRVFKPKESDLPQIRNVGDVVVLRNLNVQNRNFGLVGLFSHRTRAVVFPNSRILNPKDKNKIQHELNPMPCIPPEQLQDASILRYVVDVHANAPSTSNMSAGTSPAVPRPTPQSRPSLQLPSNVNRSPIDFQASMFQTSQKFKLIKDLDIDVYADVVVQIVKLFYNKGYGYGESQVELSVTDYTENPRLFNHENSAEETDSGHMDPTGAILDHMTEKPISKGKIPPGQYTLPVKLFSPHSMAARQNFKEGDFCFLKNIRTKTDQNNRLEARLSSDHKYPDQVNIRKIDRSDVKVKDIMDRYAQYVKRLNAPKPPPKNNKRKREEKKARKRKDAEERRALEEKEAKRAAIAAAVSLSNPNIVTAHQQKEISRLSDIVDCPSRTSNLNDQTEELPFVNAGWRASVRVVDFWPPDLADFARNTSDERYNPKQSGATDVSEEDALEDEIAYHTQSLSQHKRGQWEWNFVLLIEDAVSPTATTGGNTKDSHARPTRLELRVGNHAAQYLLKMDASDLSQDNQALSLLREKLFILWGDLEEQKASNAGMRGSQLATSSTPFECCIVEYGVRDDETQTGWRRTWGLRETTIK